MTRTRRGLATLLAVATVLAILPASTVTPASAAQFDPKLLQAQALASLNAGYRVLVNGVADEPLVPDRSEVGIQRTSAERLAGTLYRRDFNLLHGLRFTMAEVQLKVIAVEATASSVLLHAEEQTDLRYVSSTRPDPKPDVATTWVRHAFAFSPVGRSWRLEFDDTGGMRNGGPVVDPLPNIQPAIPLGPGSKPLSGRQAPTASGAVSAFSVDLESRDMTASAYGTYDRNRAATHAFVNAYGHTSGYRNWHDNDCTNFVSQALREGGWQDKTGWYLDWNNWWYTSSLQTSTWINVGAMRQFMSTSGRAVSLAYINDLLKGDVLQVDFRNDGSWDHALMVNEKFSSNLADIKVAYHDNDWRDRPMSDFLAAVQETYGNSLYNAWKIIHTSN